VRKIDLGTDSELLYRNLVKMKGIKTAKHAKSGVQNRENKYKYTLHGRDSILEHPVGTPQ